MTDNKITGIAAVILLIAIVLGVYVNVKGSERIKRDVHTVNTEENFQFAFHYHEEEPVFEFISPSNKKYKEGSEGLTVERATQVSGLKSIYFLFEHGEIGVWEIYYDKISNQTIEMFYTE